MRLSCSCPHQRVVVTDEMHSKRSFTRSSHTTRRLYVRHRNPVEFMRQPHSRQTTRGSTQPSALPVERRVRARFSILGFRNT